MSMKRTCPVCRKSVKASPENGSEDKQFFPFCSQRCKLVDLGAWLDSRYTIISNSQFEESGGFSNTVTDDSSENKQ